MRDLMANLIYPVLKITGFRFSKDYRWGVTAWHRAVYKYVNTIQANIKAGV